MLPNINLLLRREELSFSGFRIQVLTAVGVAVIILLLWHMAIWRQVDLRTKQIQYLQHQLYLPKTVVREPNKAKTKLQETLDRITTIEEERARLPSLFARLNHAMPPSVWSTQLIIKDHDIKLHGKANTMSGVTTLLQALVPKGQLMAPIVQKVSWQEDAYDFILSLSPKSGS